jgi:hypothetical protein
MYADPLIVRRQRQRLYYAENRDKILKQQRQSRERKKSTTSLPNGDTHTPPTGQSAITQLRTNTCAGYILHNYL